MNKIKFLRESRGLTQQTLADNLGLGRSTIAMYETDKSEPDFATLIKLSNLFGVSVDEIVGNALIGRSPAAYENRNDTDAYPHAGMVNDFTNKAKITEILKEIIILPKSKENLILQILNDDEKALVGKNELLAMFDELGANRQADVLDYVRGLLQINTRGKATGKQTNIKPFAAGTAAENGVISVYKKGNDRDGK